MPAPYPTWAVNVSRVHLGLANLVLTDEANGFVIARNGIGPGAASKRKITVTAPWVEGRFLVNAIADIQTLKVDVRVSGPDFDWLDARIMEVVAAFSQWDFNLEVQVDGVDHQWQCEMCDGWSVGQGGVIQDVEVGSFTQIVTFNVPRQPTPLVGRW